MPEDSFPRLFCSAVSSEKLMDLHNFLCHPAVAWKTHYYISEEYCHFCGGSKNYARLLLAKSLQNVNFFSLILWADIWRKLHNHLPSVTQDKFIVILVSEYSRFRLAIPSTDCNLMFVLKFLHVLYAQLHTFGRTLFIFVTRTV